MTSARDFASSTLSGRDRGRPRTTGLFEASDAARARVAAQRWQSKALARGLADRGSLTANPGLIQSAQGVKQQERKFGNIEGGFDDSARTQDFRPRPEWMDQKQ
jgi:hypothetical protein